MIAFVCPTYERYVYARRAALSFFKYTPGGRLILVDDGSPRYDQQDWAYWREDMPADRVTIIREQENKGLTHGWNVGLEMAEELGATYAIAGNNDILFTPDWHESMTYALDNDWALVGPVSNAPGRTTRLQNVDQWFPNYTASDVRGDMHQVAEYLKTHFACRVERNLVNGFFMMARTKTWMDGSWDTNHVFNPANKMIKNEDELQARWLANGWGTGIVPASYILHYRAVTRGDKHRHGHWLRLTDPAREF